MRKPDTIVDTLKDAEQTLREFKNPQFAGADNLVITTNQTGSTYDKTATIAGGATGSIIVTFDADNQDYAFTDPTFVVYEDGTAPANFLFTLRNDSSPTNVGGTTGSVREKISSASTPKRTRWEILIFNGGLSSHPYYVKAYVRCADTGTIS
jgi:hypothetical protein